jgi:Ca-activated chloride channel family protein
LVEDGTAIGSAIASAGNRLKEREAKSRIIVLLTDGDNNAGKISPATAAEAAKALGIKVYTIGAGTRGYAPMPVMMFGRKVYQNVKVDVDEDTLKHIAKITDAQFYRATDSKSLREIFDDIDKLEKSTVKLNQYKEVRELFPWVAAVGGGLLALYVFLGQTLWRRIP